MTCSNLRRKCHESTVCPSRTRFYPLTPPYERLKYLRMIEFTAWSISSRIWNASPIRPSLFHVRTSIAYCVANQCVLCADGIHLKQCVTLYLFSLPFTLVRDLAWSMIPVVTVVAFTLMGIEGIANEIEMPFGMAPPSSCGSVDA